GDVRACSPTGNDGAFTFTLPWGRYRVHIRDDALTAIGCDPSLDADIILTPAHPNVRRMLSVIAATASISGTVRDRLGGTVDGAVIRPQSLGGWSGLVALGLCAAALSDHSGRFTLAVPPGVFALHARADGYGAGVTGDVAPGQDVDIVLVPEGTIFGLVVDAASGEGIAGATVRAVRRATAGQPPIASATESD
ncbi:MAG: carboxypeptidase regulatory-like domain-containing protein, partial [Myxococcales bacterium]|nr:carboxypeptidase regulatory-like domain-containing protein [Myxococcales bacterium]